ncbi:cell envelope integrity protein CreD [Thermodesulfobacteriota bacterium]
MTGNEDIIKKIVNHIKRSVTLKIISVGILILLLLIPAVMVQELIRERQQRRNSVVNEISLKWGGSQTVTGPFITLPFKKFYKDIDGETQFNLHYLHILPETLYISGKIEPQIRYRSLFEAVVYNAELKFKGSFKIPESDKLNIDSNNILWDKAYLSLGITDMRGIRDRVEIQFNDIAYNTDPGLKTADLSPAGVCTLIKELPRDKTSNFSFDLNLKGSDEIAFVPVGKSNYVKVDSSWPSPSFSGAFLPTSREIKKDGFSAAWKVLHLNRNYPQFWEGLQYQVTESPFGVKLVLMADIYQKSMRLAKYSIMFLIFTFASFFFSEIINKQRIHPIQYILIGVAVLIFYVLVLSFSEHMHFNYAYILSAISVTLIISGYARAIVNNSRFSLTIFGMLIILYGYLFIVIQLEDYALIFGSIGLLVLTAAVMFMTRNINWYAIETGQSGNNNHLNT